MNPVGFPATSDFEEISVEDRLSIQDQVARYSWAFDSGNLEEYLGRFWPDGVLEHPKRDGTPGRFEGHEGIREFIRDFKGRETQTWGHQHQLNTMLMERKGPEEIQLNAYCVVLRHEFHRPYWPTGSSFRVGTWHALYTQRDLHWRISLLQIRMWTDVSIGQTGVDAVDRPPHSPGTRQ
ncbi:nuclear transport factor 2 family protein [Nesterenkonia haasae]|uniref:nuclear transport factor 2 family protein n=1 Tax=Nesterenkonia haasae TaxID=2587813 RepID=UPI0013910576|nr:nuclear transport factor 2 family protein [Nesterenkonia haasae]NDK31966.1 hypothetical protein [Nesterenkonia haasae]